MARILVVKHLFPYPPIQGTRRVSLALLADLATRHEVVFLCQRERRDEQALIPHIERLGVRVVAPLMPNHRSPVARALYKAWNLPLSKWRDIPAVCLYWSNRALRSHLERLQREFAPELTILESWETFLLRSSVHRGRSALLAHDVGYQIVERALHAASDPGARARLHKRLERERQLEREAWTRFDAVFALTEADRDTIARDLEGLAGARGVSARPALVRHLPVPVAEEFFRYGRPDAPAMRIGFLGTFRADFNRDALAHLLDDIWPVVRARLPRATLTIAGNGAGRQSTAALREAASSRDARWLGSVEDLASFFEAIDLLVVPLRFGGGVRIRILEAFAAGVPVIATPVAAAGLPVEPGQHLLIAEGAELLAGQIVRALEHPGETAKLGSEAREWCRRHHSAESLRPGRLAVIDEALSLPSSDGPPGNRA